jgi:hypothetical protein
VFPVRYGLGFYVSEGVGLMVASEIGFRFYRNHEQICSFSKFYDCIQEVSTSNLDQDTEYPYLRSSSDFLEFSSHIPGQYSN